MLVPEKMDETYRFLRDTLRGTATYDHYQRVAVATDVKIAKPLVKPPG